jgi:hypothetical protein
MYQALVRMTNDDMTAASTPPAGSAEASPETPRFDWAALLDGLLRRTREVGDGARPRGNGAAR